MPYTGRSRGTGKKNIVSDIASGSATSYQVYTSGGGAKRIARVDARTKHPIKIDAGTNALDLAYNTTNFYLNGSNQLSLTITGTATDLNYYTTGASLVGNILSGSLAGTTAFWTADLSALSDATYWSSSSAGVFQHETGTSVGIGTKAPSAKLHLSGNSAYQFKVTSGTKDLFYVSGGIVSGTNFYGDASNLRNIPGALWISSSGKLYPKGIGNQVGIGTIPDDDTPLHVSGAGTNIMWNNENNQPALHLLNSSSNGEVLRLTSRADGTTMYIQTDHIYNSSALHISNGQNVYLRGGNIGVRTTNPKKNFHVAGTSLLSGATNIDGRLQVSGNLLVSGTMVLVSGETVGDIINTMVDAPPADSLATSLAIANYIGQVSGNILAASGGKYSENYDWFTTSSSAITSALGSGAAYSSAYRWTNASGAKISEWYSASSSKLSQPYRWMIASSSAITSALGSGASYSANSRWRTNSGSKYSEAYRWVSENSGSVDNFWISGSNQIRTQGKTTNLLVSGNLGIGASSSEKLFVKGDTFVSGGTIKAYQTARDVVIDPYHIVGGDNQYSAILGSEGLLIATPGDSYVDIWSTKNRYTRFRHATGSVTNNQGTYITGAAASTEFFRIKPTGTNYDKNAYLYAPNNVTLAGKDLTLDANEDMGFFYDGQFDIYSDQGHGVFTIRSGTHAAFEMEADGDMIWKKNKTTKLMSLTSGGNLGIGNVTPSYPLHVLQGSNTYGIYMINNSSRGLRFGDTSANGTGYGKIEGLGGSLFLGSTQIYTSFIPTGDLDVKLGETNRRWNRFYTNSGAIGYSNGKSENNPYVLAVSGSDTKNPLIVNASGTNYALVVASGGKVGVGYYNPSEALQVSGNIRIDDGTSDNRLIFNNHSTVFTSDSNDSSMQMRSYGGNKYNYPIKWVGASGASSYHNISFHDDFVMISGNKVGIGDVTAGSVLHISGNTDYNNTGGIRLGTTSTFASLFMSNSSGGVELDSPHTLRLDAGRHLEIDAGSGRDTRFMFNGTERAVIRENNDGTPFVEVGINVTNPDEMLEVGTNTDATVILGRSVIGASHSDYASFQHYDVRGTANSYALLQSDAGRTHLNSADGESIRFRINNSDKMILSGSNFGIGTITPTESFDVRGNTFLSGAVTIASGNNLAVGADGKAEQSILLYSDTAGRYLNLRHYGNYASENWGNTHLHKYFDYQSWQSSTGTYYGRMNSTGVAFGHNNPQHKLDILGTSLLSGNVFVSGGLKLSSGSTVDTITNSLSASSRARSLADAATIFSKINTTSGALNSKIAGAGGTNYWGSGTNAIYPDAKATKVGIGTLNPKYMLHVSGTSDSSNDAKVMIESREPLILVSSSRSDTLWRFSADNSNGVFYFRRNNDLVGKIDDTNGWVFGYPGVPSMPGTKVDVRGNTLLSGTLYFNSGASTGVNKINVYNNNRFDMYVAGQRRWMYDSSKIFSETSGGPLLDLTPTVGEANYGFVDDPDTGMSRTAANTLGFLTAGVTGMTIDSSQRVGIGTATPGQLLEIDGGNARIKDDHKLLFGDSSDMQLYHSAGGSSYFTNGTNGLILWNQDAAGGNILLRADREDYGVQVQVSGTEVARFVRNGGEVRLGINKTNPGYPLDVYGNIHTSEEILLENNKAIKFYQNGGSTYHTSIRYNTSNELDLRGLTGVNLGSYNGGWKNNVIIKNTGKVGMGLNAPTPETWLDIKGDNSIWPILLLSGSSDHGTGLKLINGASGGGSDVMKWSIVGGGSSASAGPKNSLRFYNETDADFKMVLTSGGNLGIGGPNVDVTDPDEKLHVVGNSLISGSSYIMGSDYTKWNQTVNASGKWQLIQGTTQRIIGSSGEFQFANDVIVDNDLIVNTSAQLANGRATILDASNPQLTLAYDGSKYTTFKQDANDFKIMNEGTGDDIIINPNDKVQLHANGINYATKDDTAYLYIQPTGTDGDAGANIFNLTAGQNITLDAKADTVFKADGTEVMRVTDDDRVGINRSSPNAKLHVGAGNILVSGAASYIDVGKDGGYQSTIRAESNTPLEIRGDSGYGANIKYVRNNGSYGFFAGMLSNGSRFDIANNTGVSGEAISVLSDRKVGINTINPQAILDVSGNSILARGTGNVYNGSYTNVLEMREYSSGRGQICFYPAGGTSKNRIYASTEASANMVMHADASILMDPDEKFIVDAGDDINLDAATGIFNYKYQDAEKFRITAGASSPIAFQPKADEYDMSFKNYDGTEVMRITDDLRVGIGTFGGTTSPTGKLHVSSSKPVKNSEPFNSFIVSGTEGHMMYPFAGDAGSINLALSGNAKHTGFLMATDSASKDVYMQMGNGATQDNIQWAFSGPLGSSSTVMQINDYHGTHQIFYASGGNLSNFGKKGGRAGIFATPYNKGGAFNGITGHKNMMGLAVGSGAASATWNLGLGKGLWLHDNANDITEFWKNNKGTKMLALGSGSYDVIVPGTLNVVGNLYQNGSQITPGGGGGGGAPTDASYVTLGTDGDLSAERVLTAGSDIDLADGGAGSTVTINLESELNTPTGIYNTSLKVGRDAHNLIDYGTDNEINFRAGNADQMKITNGTLEPETDNDISLGTSSKGFSAIKAAEAGAFYVGASGGISQTIQVVNGVTPLMGPGGTIVGLDVTQLNIEIKGGIITRVY
tara:strand:- start:17488 stop:25419 length:7932 start_codon:yes stop_codon:yes gene_type:complete